jgi:hypothetical protein
MDLEAAAAAAPAARRRALIVHPLHPLAPAAPLDAPPPPPTWRALPPEVLRLVATNLEARDLARLAAVCRDLRALAADEGVWRALCAKQWAPPRRPRPPPSGWRELYIFLYRLHRAVLRGEGARGAPALGPPLQLGGGALPLFA